MRFFQQVSFNNSNPFSVLWSLWVQMESYEYILNFVPSFWATYKRTRNLILYHHFELPRREPETIFDSMIGWYLQKRKKVIFNYLPGHMYFLAPVWSQVRKTLNLKYLKTGVFLSVPSVILGFLTPNTYPYQIQDERVTRTIVITESIYSKWWILPRNTHFGQIFKSQWL